MIKMIKVHLTQDSLNTFLKKLIKLTHKFPFCEIAEVAGALRRSYFQQRLAHLLLHVKAMNTC